MMGFAAEVWLGRGEPAAAQLLAQGQGLCPKLAWCANADVMENDGYTARKKGEKRIWRKGS